MCTFADKYSIISIQPINLPLFDSFIRFINFNPSRFYEEIIFSSFRRSAGNVGMGRHVCDL